MRTAWLPATGLFLLAPVCAEYLWGYDDSTGHWGVLIGNLIVFSPLYGAPALLIREAARRLGLGWPGILLMAAAFGVIQAGIVDQSMWSTGYRDIPYWQDMSVPTYIEPIGLSIYLAVSFVCGHVILSIGSPIAIVESLTPRRREGPWLSRLMIVVVAVLYAGASALVLGDAVSTGEASATPWQLVGCAVVAVGLIAAAVLVGRRPISVVPARAWRPWQVGLGAFVGMFGFVAIPPTRIGTALVVLLGLVAVRLVWWQSRRADWEQAHVLALAGGALVAAGCFAFGTTPIGDVSDQQKYAHNVVLLLLVAALTVWGARRSRAG